MSKNKLIFHVFGIIILISISQIFLFHFMLSPNNKNENKIRILNINNVDVTNKPLSSTAPYAPSNPSPADGATEVSLNPTLSVDVYDPDGDLMDLGFFDRQTNDLIGFVDDIESGGRASVVWENLYEGTTYYWNVVVDDNIGSNSSHFSFTTTQGNAPNPPSNPSPTHEATGVSLFPILSVDVFNPGGDPMDVYFYEKYTNNLIGVDSSVASGGTASITWEYLSQDKTYWWYAVAIDDDCISGARSDYFRFETTIGQAPNAPSNPSPANGAIGVSCNPTLSVDVFDPDGNLMDVDFFDMANIDLIGSVDGVESGGRASVIWEGLSWDTTYEWTVIAHDGKYQNSSRFSFTTASGYAPNPPTNPSPANGATGVKLNTHLIVHVTDPDGDPMDVYFYNVSDGSLIGVDSGVLSGNNAMVWWEGLARNTTYSWYAVADDDDTVTGTQSAIWSFTTLRYAPNAPTNPSPADTAIGVSLNPTLSVDVSDPDGDTMDVYFYNFSDGRLIDVDSGVLSGETASVVWDGLAKDTSYSWYAVADDDDTVTGTQSAIWSFTTTLGNVPDPPTNPSPADGTTGESLNPTLNVDVFDPDGDPMDVYFYNASDGSLIGVDTGVASGGTASVIWELLFTATTYSWYAVADDEDTVTGSQSTTWTFTTILSQAPNTPINPTPANKTTGVSLNPILSVEVSDPDRDSMDVYFYTYSDGSLIGVDTGVASGGIASITWEGLSKASTYLWYAVANDTISGTKSAIWLFTTLADNDNVINVPDDDDDNDNDDSNNQQSIPSGNFYLYFLVIGIIGLLIYIKHKKIKLFKSKSNYF